MRSFAVILALAAACGGNRAPDEAAVARFLRDAPPPVRERLLRDADARPRKTDVINRAGAPLTLVGDTLDVGDRLPAVELVDPQLAPIALKDLQGKLIVLSVVPSIDTRVCESQTHHVSDAIPQLPAGAVVITVSRDLPFAQGRFAEEAMTKTLMGSDARARAFGRAFGLEVEETGLLARSVWVIAPDGTIAYREIVADQSTEPAYEPLLAAAQKAAGG